MIPTSLRAGLAAAALAAAAVLAPAGAALAADEIFISDAAKGIAINGYDPVAYHSEGAPVKGSADFKFEHEGAVYKFSSAENLAAFEADPARYAPAYGGWCAVGTSKAKKIPTQPELFAIVDGQLYLNSSEGAHKLFKGDKPGTISTADANWTRIETTPAAEL
ncbi:MAG: YHS domain-containing (seleno)protein [Pseudomonadota bacterium]